LRAYNKTLTTKTTHPNDKDFIIRMLSEDCHGPTDTIHVTLMYAMFHVQYIA